MMPINCSEDWKTSRVGWTELRRSCKAKITEETSSLLRPSLRFSHSKNSMSSLQKLESVSAEIEARRDNVKEALTKARELKTQDGYSNAAELLNTAEQISARYAGLGEPVTIRRENLRDAQRLFQWAAEARDLEEWAEEQLPTMRSTDTGLT